MMRMIAFGIIAVLVLGGAWYFLRRPQTVEPPSVVETAPEAPTSTPEKATATKPVAPKPTSGTNLSYGEAVAVFSNRRIQFDAACVVTPNRAVFRNGTNVMFDNRAAEARTFALDGTTYSLKAYGFRILTLKAVKLPHTIVVDCGTGRNNAEIILN